MMSRRMIWISILVGLPMGILILQPLAIAISRLNIQEIQNYLWSYMMDTYSHIAGFRYLDQAVINILFGILGISLVLIITIRKKIFQLITRKKKMMEVKARIAEGNNQEMEYNSTLRWDFRLFKPNIMFEHVVVKTIAGFMNTQGGNLLITFEKGGWPLGFIEDSQASKKPGRDDFKQYIMRLIAVKMGTQYCRLVNVDNYQFKDQNIRHLSIRRSSSPAYVLRGGRTHFYIRTGNGTRELDKQEALDYIEEHVNH